jgi:F-type H+-transporting ATPase subunit delta
MKVSKENRKLSRTHLRASFTGGMLDRAKVAEQVRAIIASKPRNLIQLLENYRRLVRLEVEKRSATIESATELGSAARQQIVTDLKKKYGGDLTADFAIKPELLGGVRIRVGSDVWDGSVRNRLARLQEQL